VAAVPMCLFRSAPFEIFHKEPVGADSRRWIVMANRTSLHRFSSLRAQRIFSGVGST
jgi:hypothetical protein